jgi:hypothetical protein
MLQRKDSLHHPKTIWSAVYIIAQKYKLFPIFRVPIQLIQKHIKFLPATVDIPHGKDATIFHVVLPFIGPSSMSLLDKISLPFAYKA